MDELVQDLTSALEESELKNDKVIQPGYCHKRRIRKRRPLVGLSLSQIKTNDSCSPEQGCNVEMNMTGSDTESGFVLPMIKKHRRKKIKRMDTETPLVPLAKTKCALKVEEKKMELDFCTEDKPTETDADNKSKYEEESGISASDESNEDIDAQDGDDEMTDFYNEPGGGAVCGIPSIIPWWEEDSEGDPRLKSIINRALPLMSESAKIGFHARVNRLPGMAARSIRRGRRKFKHKKINNERLAPSEIQGKEFETLKRRRTEEIIDGPHILSANMPIPNTNRGHKMLISMGWNPGEGLGVRGQGIHLPVLVTRRQKRTGLGL